LIQPILTTVMYMFVYGGLAKISTDGAPQPLFYLSAIMLWNYFSDSFNASSNVFVSNASVFGKVYFPRLIVSLARLTSNLVKMAIQLILFILVYIGYRIAGVARPVYFTVRSSCALPCSWRSSYSTAWNTISWTRYECDRIRPGR
jgi:lipopolysaccharide transport system permease protein